MPRLLTLLLLVMPLLGQADPAPPAGCLGVDAPEIARLERELARSAVFVSSSHRRGSPFSDPECSVPSDGEYLQLLRELTSALGPGLINSARIAVDVNGKQQGYIRTAYNEVRQGTCCFGPCGGEAAVRYSVSPAYVAELGQHIRSSVVPHLRRMAELGTRFAVLTGEMLQPVGSAEHGVVVLTGSIKIHPYASQRATSGPADAELFSALENVAATLLREIERLPPGQLAAHRNQRSELRAPDRTWLFDEVSLSVASRPWPVQALPQAVRELYDPTNVTAERDP